MGTSKRTQKKSTGAVALRRPAPASSPPPLPARFWVLKRGPLYLRARLINGLPSCTTHREQAKATKFATKREAMRWAKAWRGRPIPVRRKVAKVARPQTEREPQTKHFAEPKRTKHRKGSEPPPPGTRRLSRAERKALEAVQALQDGIGKGLRGSVTDTISRSELLLQLAKQAEHQETVESKKRAKTLRVWRKDPHRSKVSRHTIAFFKQYGNWHKNKDGTESGEIRLPVPPNFQCHFDYFRYWLGDWEVENEFLRAEPLWYSVGFQVTGVERKNREKYDRIHGRVAICSYWGKSLDMGGKRYGQGPGLGGIMTTMREKVARNVIFASRCISSVVIFAHWGPVAPLGT